MKNCIATAGFSVGELTALIFSGALSFEDGLRLVQVRGQAMQDASDLESSGIFAIKYTPINLAGKKFREIEFHEFFSFSYKGGKKAF